MAAWQELREEKPTNKSPCVCASVHAALVPRMFQLGLLLPVYSLLSLPRLDQLTHLQIQTDVGLEISKCHLKIVPS